MEQLGGFINLYNFNLGFILVGVDDLMGFGFVLYRVGVVSVDGGRKEHEVGDKRDTNHTNKSNKTKNKRRKEYRSQNELELRYIYK